MSTYGKYKALRLIDIKGPFTEIDFELQLEEDVAVDTGGSNIELPGTEAQIGICSKTDASRQFPPEGNRNTILSECEHEIAVVTADSDGMKETGFGSVETCQAFCNSLKDRYRNISFHKVTTRADLSSIADQKPDLVVLCCKYLHDRSSETNIWLSEFFEDRAIAFTGSDRFGLEFDSNKAKAKTILINNGIATAKFFLTHPDQYGCERDLPFALPVFVKPLDAANGNGVDENSMVRDFAGYTQKVGALFETYGAKVLVEEVLPGREFTVAILDDVRNGTRLTMPVEIVPPKNANGDRILGFREKSGNDEKLENICEPLLSSVSALAGKAFSVLGARDFGRIDIKLDAHGEPHFLEANLVPGMTPGTSYFPRACAMSSRNDAVPGAGAIPTMTYKDVARRITELALDRARTAKAQ